MHDDQPGGVPQGPDVRLVLRHFDHPVTVRELLHSTLDRLLDQMLKHGEPQGVVAVTCMDEDKGDHAMAGRTVVLALDLDPHAAEYDGLYEGLDGN